MKRGLLPPIAAVTLAAFFVGLAAATYPAGAGQSEIIAPQSGSGRIALPNDCAIVATEAASRLAPAASWTRLLFIVFIDPRDGHAGGHVVTVWQAPTATTICEYDASGTWDLDTESHDPKELAFAWAHLANVLLIEAHFLK